MIQTSSAESIAARVRKEEKAFLAKYERRNYDSPLATVDMAIFCILNAKLNVLLIERGNFPAKHQWALPGGIVDLATDNDLTQTAHRKLFEKTGLRTPYLEQVETIGNGTRDPRGWSLTVLHFALVDLSAMSQASDMAKDLQGLTENGLEGVGEKAIWVPVERALKTALAFDHHLLLEKALARLRSKTRYTALPMRLMPSVFSLTELQEVFEIVLGRTLEKKSFRRRVQEANLLEETGGLQASGRRPAALYRIRASIDQFTFARPIEG